MSSLPPPPTTPTPTGGSQPTQSGAATTSAPPPKPKMGSCEETYPGSGVFYYVFGGEPSRYWQSIKDPSKRSFSDLCFRSLDPVSGQKSTRLRTKGISKKYESRKSLTEFQSLVWDHLVKYGLDTMSYLPDPKDDNLMLSVIKNHAQFTGNIDQCIDKSNRLQLSFDTWDKKHDMEAKTFLLDSLSEELRRDFRPFHSEVSDSFAITWLKLVHYLVSSNSKNFDKIKETIRSMRPQQYAGQNIEKMAADYILKSEELVNGGYFDFSLILSMVDGFLCATPDSRGTFHHAMNTLRYEVDTLQQKTVFMDRNKQEEEYALSRLSFKDVCYRAVKVYKTLCDDNSWEPKKLPRDRNAPATTLNLAALNKALNLVANNSGNDLTKFHPKGGKKPICFNCGKFGHIAPECPEPPNKQLRAKLSKEFKTRKLPKWIRTPPKAGESHTKTVNGRTYYWCEKCNKWVTTHNTETHRDNFRKGKGKKGKKVSFGESNIVLFEPSAWLAEVYKPEPTPFYKKPAVLYIYFALTVLVLSGLPVQSFSTIVNIVSEATSFSHFASTISSTFHIQYYINILLHTIFQQLPQVLAPLFWITLGVISTKISNWFSAPFNPVVDLEHVPRVIRRSKSPPSRRYKLKSARDHQLTPKYPLRLRNEHKFNSRRSAPTVKQREKQEFYSNIINESHHYKSKFNHHRYDHSDIPWTKDPPNRHNQFKRQSCTYKSKGGKRSTYDSCPFDRNYDRFRTDCQKHRGHRDSFCKYKKPVRKDLSKPKSSYIPTGLMTSRDMPNLNLTSTQRKCIKDVATSIYLTGANVSKKFKTFARDIALLTPSGYNAAIKLVDEKYQFEVIWDSGASVCVTPSKEDFISYQEEVDIKGIKGVNGDKSHIAGQGEVLWSIFDVNGGLRSFKLKAYHIPSSKSRLISTSYLLSKFKDEDIVINNSCLKLSGSKSDKDHTPVIVYNSPSTMLPTSIAYNLKTTNVPTELLCQTVATVSSSNRNLSESQKELLRWHQRLGHLEFKKIQHLMRTGVLSHTEGTRSLHTAAAKLKEIPKCAACLFGKQTVRPSPGTTTRVVKDRAGILKSGNLLPGQEVSVDHFISSVRGRLFTGYNRGRIEDRFVGGCIFVDHASSNIHVEFQSSLSSHETLAAKQAYENVCKDVGVVPQVYMSDNGKAFTSKEFVEHLSQFYQISKLAGVGAHHHNAQAERAIRTIMSIARTMMIHAGIHWPDVADPSLWPMAVKHATYLYNHVPSHTTGLSPSDLFTKTRWPQKKFLDMHVWGCPVYVLEKALQDGNKIPRWKPRSHRSVYVGVSSAHASTVPLVLNVSTGAITPQFHVVFDDWFATVPSESENLPDFNSDDWKKMFGESRFQYVLDEEAEEQENEVDSNSDLQATLESTKRSDKVSEQQEIGNPSRPLDVDEPSTKPVKDERPEDNVKIDEESHTPQETLEEADFELTSPDPVQEETAGSPVKSSLKKTKKKSSSFDEAPRRSRRLRRGPAPIERLTYSGESGSFTGKINLVFHMVNDVADDNLVHVQSLLPDHYVLVSKKEADPDLFTYEQAMSSEHRLEWIKAAVKEIEALEKFGCWIEVPLSSATTKVLPGTWVFKVKRAPDGSFKKFKARYCVRGDLQEGDFETFAPVVQFSSVRLFLAWSLLFGWYTCSVDFSNAFIQATLKEDTFIHLPRGFRSTKGVGTCLKLKKSLYGLAVAPRLWYEHLWNALKKQGLVQSSHDKCLLFRKDLIVICYVDDLGIQAPNKRIVDQLVKALIDDGLDLTVEGTFTEYLGIKYNKVDSDTVKMSQEGLIQKIIDATGMNGCNPHPVPTTVEGLSSNEEGKPMQNSWNYRSVIGMMLYLSSNTRPDIAYAVSQVARFSHSPKQSHADAVKLIVRYLSGTRTEGIIFKRPQTLKIECYVDADFAGLYNREAPENPTCVKSRTGYIISVGGCFILCKSQLQSVIALSTSEAEYGALSHAMRAVIPLRETLLEMISKVDMIDSKSRNPFGSKEEVSKFPTIIYEDNSAALSLATNQKVTSRTKHWCVKYHFFWSYINEEDNNTKCERVSTDLQKADYLTKGLPKLVFKKCRHLNQGW